MKRIALHRALELRHSFMTAPELRKYAQPNPIRETGEITPPLVENANRRAASAQS